MSAEVEGSKCVLCDDIGLTVEPAALPDSLSLCVSRLTMCCLLSVVCCLLSTAACSFTHHGMIDGVGDCIIGIDDEWVSGYEDFLRRVRILPV